MREDETERDRMPYIQIESDRWVVMREHKDRPKAVIQRVKWIDGSEQFLLFTWHSDSAQRRLVKVLDSLEDANRAVRWPKIETPPEPFPPFSRDDPR